MTNWMRKVTVRHATWTQQLQSNSNIGFGLDVAAEWVGLAVHSQQQQQQQ
jgi:hypothetical protein